VDFIPGDEKHHHGFWSDSEGLWRHHRNSDQQALGAIVVDLKRHDRRLGWHSNYRAVLGESL